MSALTCCILSLVFYDMLLPVLTFFSPLLASSFPFQGSMSSGKQGAQSLSQTAEKRPEDPRTLQQRRCLLQVPFVCDGKSRRTRTSASELQKRPQTDQSCHDIRFFKHIYKLRSYCRLNSDLLRRLDFWLACSHYSF